MISKNYGAESISLHKLQDLGLSGFTGLFISSYQGQNLIYSYPQAELTDKQELLKKIVKNLEQTYMLSASSMQNILEKKIKQDLYFYALLGLLVVCGFLFLIFRKMTDVFWSFLPPLSAVLVLLGTFSLLNISLNLFHAAAIPLLIGLGVDYGIFMVYWKKSRAASSTPKAVLTSALSTILAFGVLIWARHPALHSLGLAVFIGVLAAAFCALLVVPRKGKNI